MRLIGISGQKRSGKGTIATTLTQHRGYTEFSFASVLKNMLRTLLTDLRLDASTIERMIDGDLKEMPCPELGGKTARHAMQTLGTEWGRNCIDPNIWVNATIQHAVGYGMRRSVISDVRFDNEADAVQNAGGYLIRVVRPSFTGDNHSSECQNFDVDAVVINSEGIEDLQTQILTLENALYD